MRRPWLYPSEHAAKAEVYREFAETFSGMRAVIGSPKEQRAALAKQQYMRLALVDPLVRDGLEAALRDADEHWSMQGRLTGADQ